MSTKSKTVILELIRKAMNCDYQVDSRIFKDSELGRTNWAEVKEIATTQGVLGVCFDAIEQLDVSCRPDMIHIMDWLGQVSFMEICYEAHQSALEELATFYQGLSIKMMVLKGMGLSFNYPHPNHRPCGDIDIYLYGDGGKADASMLSKLGIESKQNEEKHSIFSFKGIMVENHACIINDIRHSSHQALEKYFEQQANYALTVDSIHNGSKGFFVPPVSFNAIYLPLHIAGHFVRGEASLRQLCDWACFVQKYHYHISWSNTAEWAKKTGFFKFYCCLNGIVQDYLGIDPSYFPDWPRNKKLEDQVLNDILTKREHVQFNLFKKVIRYFASGWKFRLVYNENILLASFRQARAYALVKWNKGGKNIWENS